MSLQSNFALSPRVVYWSKTIGQFSLFQLAVQALLAASGLLLIHALDQNQYAYFTLAYTMQATIMVLADSGVSTGLNAIGGRIWQNPFRFGQLLHTALRLQRYLALTASGIVVPFLLWLLLRHGVSLAYAVSITVVILFSLAFQLPASVLTVAPRLYSRIKRLQNLDLLIAASRFILLAVAFRLFLNAVIAIGIVAFTMGLQYAVLRRWVSEEVDTHAPMNEEDRMNITRIIKHQAPSGVFYCLQGQLTIWLISLFGSTQKVAEVGALSRLAIIYSVIAAIMNSIILPSFSRCQSRPLLHRRYLQIVGSFVLFGACVVTLTRFFPNQCLWILGKNYAHLQNEVFLMAINTVLASIVGVMWSMNAAKAWVQHCWVEIPLRIALQIALLFAFDLSTVRAVLLFGALSNISPFLVNLLLTYNGLWKNGAATAEAFNVSDLNGKANARAA